VLCFFVAKPLHQAARPLVPGRAQVQLTPRRLRAASSEQNHRQVWRAPRYTAMAFPARGQIVLLLILRDGTARIKGTMRRKSTWARVSMDEIGILLILSFGGRSPSRRILSKTKGQTPRAKTASGFQKNRNQNPSTDELSGRNGNRSSRPRYRG